MSEQAPDHSVPSQERQKELTLAYQKNTRRKRQKKPPYADVAFHTAGEIAWVIAEHPWQPGADFAGNQCIDLRKADLRKVNLAGMDLRSADLSDARVDGTDFSKSDLRGARFSSSIVSGDSTGVLRRSYFGSLAWTSVGMTFVILSFAWWVLAIFVSIATSVVQQVEIIISGGLIYVLVGIIIALFLVERTLRKSRAIESGSIFREANLQGADLTDAYLREAIFYQAQLKETNFSRAYLKQADFSHTVLSGANFSGSNLSESHIDLVEQIVSAVINSRTILESVAWGNASMQYQKPPINRRMEFLLQLEPVLLLYPLFAPGVFFTLFVLALFISTAISDQTFSGVITLLGLVSLVLASILPYAPLILWGNAIRKPKRGKGAQNAPRIVIDQRSGRATIAAYLRDRSRVSRAIALALRQNGLYEQAAEYRLQELDDERKADFLDTQWLRWIVSSLLNLVAGYGERPVRILITYLVTIISFALLYLGIGQISFGEALVLSLTSFHGRGFFNASAMLSDAVTAVAAAEAVIGLLIEIVLIATLTRRFIPGS